MVNRRELIISLRKDQDRTLQKFFGLTIKGGRITQEGDARKQIELLFQTIDADDSDELSFGEFLRFFSSASWRGGGGARDEGEDEEGGEGKEEEEEEEEEKEDADADKEGRDERQAVLGDAADAPLAVEDGEDTTLLLRAALDDQMTRQVAKIVEERLREQEERVDQKLRQQLRAGRVTEMEIQSKLEAAEKVANAHHAAVVEELEVSKKNAMAAARVQQQLRLESERLDAEIAELASGGGGEGEDGGAKEEAEVTAEEENMGSIDGSAAAEPAATAPAATAPAASSDDDQALGAREKLQLAMVRKDSERRLKEAQDATNVLQDLLAEVDDSRSRFPSLPLPRTMPAPNAVPTAALAAVLGAEKEAEKKVVLLRLTDGGDDAAVVEAEGAKEEQEGEGEGEDDGQAWGSAPLKQEETAQDHVPSYMSEEMIKVLKDHRLGRLGGVLRELGYVALVDLKEAEAEELDDIAEAASLKKPELRRWKKLLDSLA